MSGSKVVEALFLERVSLAEFLKYVLEAMRKIDRIGSWYFMASNTGGREKCMLPSLWSH